jgi:hypothetical protein
LSGTVRAERLLAVALACALLTPRALAQSGEERQTARELMDWGDERADQRDFLGALSLYRSAHEIMHVPTTGIEVARTLANLGKPVEARDAALEVLELAEAPDEPKPFTTARAEADQLVRELTGQIPTLRIALSPPEAALDASVLIDGVASPRALSLPQPLNPEPHRVEVSAPGFRTIVLRVILAPAERESLQLEMQPEPQQPSAPPATPASVATPARAAIPRSAKSGAPSASSASWGRIGWVTWTGVGVLGAGIVTGTVAGLIVLDRVDAARKYCSGNLCTREARGDLDAAVRAGQVSNIGWAVAGAGGVLAVTSWLVSLPRSSHSSAEASLEFVPREGGGVVEWRGSL